MTYPAPDVQTDICCPRCGVVDRPTLSPGTGPHSCKAACAHCGRFLRWISLHAPAERLAHRREAARKAMMQRPPSAAQLAYLQVLRDKAAAPVSMAEANERIETLKAAKEARNSKAPGEAP